MARYINLIQFVCQERENKILENIPVTHITISTLVEYEEHMLKLNSSTFILPLLWNPPEEILNSILNETEKRKEQIIAVLIYGDIKDRLTRDSIKIYYISESYLVYGIISTIANFLDTESIKQASLGRNELGIDLYQHRKEIIEHFPFHQKLEACHILLCPVNARVKDMQNALMRIKNICHELYPSYDFKILKLSDFIPDCEIDNNDLSYANYLKKKYRAEICDIIIKLSVVRIYVVASEAYIANKWSQNLLARELDINHNPGEKYVDRCTFIRKDDAESRFRGDIVPIFGRGWQIQRAVPITFDELRNDQDFKRVLPRLDNSLRSREMVVNLELNHRASENSNEIAGVSHQMRPINQAKTGPEEKQLVDDIKQKTLNQL